MINDIIYSNSEILREFPLQSWNSYPIDITDSQEAILVEYLSKGWSPTTRHDAMEIYKYDKIWDDYLLHIIDFLMLPTERLINHYRWFGNELQFELLKKNNLVPKQIEPVLYKCRTLGKKCCKSARYGKLDFLKLFDDVTLYYASIKIIKMAIIYEHPHIIDWIISTNIHKNDKFILNIKCVTSQLADQTWRMWAYIEYFGKIDKSLITWIKNR